MITIGTASASDSSYYLKIVLNVGIVIAAGSKNSEYLSHFRKFKYFCKNFTMAFMKLKWLHSVANGNKIKKNKFIRL